MSDVILQGKKQDVYNQVMGFLERNVQVGTHRSSQYSVYVHNDAVDQFAKTGVFRFGVIVTVDLADIWNEDKVLVDVPKWAEEANPDAHVGEPLFHHHSMGKTKNPAVVDIQIRYYKRYYRIMAPFGFALDLAKEYDHNVLVNTIRGNAYRGTMAYLNDQIADGEIAVTHVPFWAGFHSHGLGSDN